MKLHGTALAYCITLAAALLGGCKSSGTSGSDSGPDVNISAVKPGITQLYLASADTGLAIPGFEHLETLSTTVQVNLAALPTRRLSIMAVGTAQSYQFQWDVNYLHIESRAPYAMCNDDGTIPLDCGIGVGTHALKVTPYSATGGAGSAGKAIALNFNVVDQPVAPQISKLALVFTDTGLAVPGFETLAPTAAVNLALLRFRGLSVIATTSPSVVGSVKVSFNGTLHNENTAPYALCNDNGVLPLDCGFAAGTYTVIMTPYSGANATGQAGTPVQTVITVTDQPPLAPLISKLALVYSDTGLAVPGYETLPASATVNLADLRTRAVSVVATANSATGSVKFDNNGATRVDAGMPFALCGDTAALPNNCGFTTGVFTIKATPYASTTGTGAVGSTVQTALTFTDITIPQISKLALVYSDTGLAVPGYESLGATASVNLATLRVRNLSVVATTTGTIGSVKFDSNGFVRTEVNSPYSLCGVSGILPNDCSFVAGVYTLKATPYVATNGTGSSGTLVQTVITFTDQQINTSKLSAVWANDGGEKIMLHEQRASINPGAVSSTVWNGSKVSLFGAKNEVVGFNLILEAQSQAVSRVAVKLAGLTGPGGYKISSNPTDASGVFDWTSRNIELFYVRYLQIKGLSLLSYQNYDERHIPSKLRRSFDSNGIGSGVWADRPGADKYFPEIAVPMELQPEFTIASGTNQSIFVDVYVPKDAPAGIYTGNVEISESGSVTKQVPVEFEVRNFALPDSPTSKTMLFIGYTNIARRYAGVDSPTAGSAQDNATKLARDRHFLLAHRHKISLIDANAGATAWSTDAPRPEWVGKLNGTFFTSANGYAGPGVSTPNDVFSIGTYGSWNWQAGGETAMRTHTNAWESWFQTNAPSAERFLYLIDESTNYTQTQTWASWVKNNPGIGNLLKTFATLGLPDAANNVPSLDISASWIAVADKTPWQNAANSQIAAGKKVFMYNGRRPATGSFATEEDGVGLRELPWAQYKKGVSRWFFWESTYYNDYQGGRGQTDVFNNAQTFGGAPTFNSVLGNTAWNHSNGDGVLFYPGTDTVFPASSYGLAGPIASLRLKSWRRGIQDVDYIAAARAVDPVRTDAIIQAIVPKALWEYGVADPADPTWQRTDISWSIDPSVWETARKQLADIIEGR